VPRFADLLAARHGADRWAAVLARTAALLEALGDRPPVTPATLATLACPVRLAVGDRDATVTLDETRDAVAALAHGELEVLPGTAHPFERAPLERVALGVRELWARAAG
jgi:pimeloyl-ACP methyl ester carboxylesterase